MTATNQQMTSQQLDELMVVAVSMQRDAEKLDDRPVAVFAYSVQLALAELQQAKQQLLELSVKLANVESKCAEVVAEAAGLKANLMFWDADNPEAPYESPDEIASEYALGYNDEFEVQVAAKLPNRVYRVCESREFEFDIELVTGDGIKTPATDAYLAEVQAQGVAIYAQTFNSGTVEGSSMKISAIEFAAQLRQGAEHE